MRGAATVGGEPPLAVAALVGPAGPRPIVPAGRRRGRRLLLQPNALLLRRRRRGRELAFVPRVLPLGRRRQLALGGLGGAGRVLPAGGHLLGVGRRGAPGAGGNNTGVNKGDRTRNIGKKSVEPITS